MVLTVCSAAVKRRLKHIFICTLHSVTLSFSPVSCGTFVLDLVFKTDFVIVHFNSLNSNTSIINYLCANKTKRLEKCSAMLLLHFSFANTAINAALNANAAHVAFSIRPTSIQHSTVRPCLLQITLYGTKLFPNSVVLANVITAWICLQASVTFLYHSHREVVRGISQIKFDVN